jgi:hypothetical protein
VGRDRAEQSLPPVLAIAVERRYLDPRTAQEVALEALRTGRPAEAVLSARALLSPRRVERLVLHVRYRSLRKADKAYAKVALRARIVDEATLAVALDLQRTRFEERRECLRLGAILVRQGHLTEGEDRNIRSRVAKLSASESASQSAAATLLDDSASHGVPQQGKRAPSYEAIDQAVARVEAVRRAQEDLSVSEAAASDADAPAPRDSAAEFENACVMLARRRVIGPGGPESKVGGSSKGGLRIGA